MKRCFLLIVFFTIYAENTLSSHIYTSNLITHEYDETKTNKKENILLNLSMTNGKNPYFCHSFCTTKLLYLPDITYTFSPLLSLYSLISDSTEYAIGFGTGLRNHFPRLSSTLGVNVFYDLKHINAEKTHQIGFGIENLSFFEVRANLYFPITKHTKSKIHHFINDRKITEIHTCKASNGCELEIGKRIYQKWTDLYFSVAPYFIFHTGSGIEYKAQVHWRSILYFGVSVYQHFSCRSNVNKGAGETVIGVVGINIPLGAESNKKKSINRIPISRWDTVRTCLKINYKNK